MLADPQARVGGALEEALKSRPARLQQQWTQVFVSVAQQVERVAGDRRLAASRLDVNASLKVLKTNWMPALVERDDLSVDHDRTVKLTSPGAERPRNLRELRRLFVTQTRPEVDGAGRLDRRDHTNAVVLRLVREIRGFERRRARRREHRPHCGGILVPGVGGHQRQLAYNPRAYSQNLGPKPGAHG